jgi:hypothetical protein
MSATAIAVMASTQSAAANSAAERAAHDARVARCTVTEATFNAGTASVQQKLNYAECIEFLYPQPSDEPLSMGSRASILAVVVVLVGATIAGAVYGWREDRDIMVACLASLCALMFAALACGGIALAVWAVKVALA